MSSLIRIENMMLSLTKAEQKLARYVVDNPQGVIHYSIQEVSYASGVSEATVVRFAKKLGFNGFKQLKFALAQDVMLQMSPYDTYTNPMSGDTLKAQALSAMKQTLDQTFAILDESVIQAVANSLQQARKIYFIGYSVSGLAIQEFQERLDRLGYQTAYHADPHIFVDLLAHIRSQDVLFVVSYSGSRKRVNRLVLFAKQTKAKIIVITGSQPNELVQLADLAICLPLKKFIAPISSLETKIAIAAALDIVYLQLIQKSSDLVQKSMQKTKALALILED